jgi:hypothetical protein
MVPDLTPASTDRRRARAHIGRAARTIQLSSAGCSSRWCAGGVETGMAAEAELQLDPTRSVAELVLGGAPLLTGHQRTEHTGEQLLGGVERRAGRVECADRP